MHWIEKMFLMVSKCSITMQSLGEIEQHALAVGAKMWCLYFFVCLSISESSGPFAQGGYSLNSYCVTVYGSIVILFQLFSEVIALSDALDNSYFLC